MYPVYLLETPHSWDLYRRARKNPWAWSDCQFIFQDSNRCRYDCACCCWVTCERERVSSILIWSHLLVYQLINLLLFSATLNCSSALLFSSLCCSALFCSVEVEQPSITSSFSFLLCSTFCHILILFYSQLYYLSLRHSLLFCSSLSVISSFSFILSSTSCHILILFYSLLSVVVILISAL